MERTRPTRLIPEPPKFNPLLPQHRAIANPRTLIHGKISTQTKHQTKAETIPPRVSFNSATRNLRVLFDGAKRRNGGKVEGKAMAGHMRHEMWFWKGKLEKGARGKMKYIFFFFRWLWRLWFSDFSLIEFLRNPNPPCVGEKRIGLGKLETTKPMFWGRRCPDSDRREPAHQRYIPFINSNCQHLACRIFDYKYPLWGCNSSQTDPTLSLLVKSGFNFLIVLSVFMADSLSKGKGKIGVEQNVHSNTTTRKGINTSNEGKTNDSPSKSAKKIKMKLVMEKQKAKTSGVINNLETLNEAPMLWCYMFLLEQGCCMFCKMPNEAPMVWCYMLWLSCSCLCKFPLLWQISLNLISQIQKVYPIKIACKFCLEIKFLCNYARHQCWMKEETHFKKSLKHYHMLWERMFFSVALMINSPNGIYVGCKKVYPKWYLLGVQLKLKVVNNFSSFKLYTVNILCNTAPCSVSCAMTLSSRRDYTRIQQKGCYYEHVDGADRTKGLQSFQMIGNLQDKSPLSWYLTPSMVCWKCFVVHSWMLKENHGMCCLSLMEKKRLIHIRRVIQALNPHENPILVQYTSELLRQMSKAIQTGGPHQECNSFKERPWIWAEGGK